MNETLKKIGHHLRQKYVDVLHLPLNWRMIDATVRLEEIEEAQARSNEQEHHARDGGECKHADPKEDDNNARDDTRRN